MIFRVRVIRIVFSLVIAFVVLALSYFRENLDKPMGGETAEIKVFEALKRTFFKESEKSDGQTDCLIVNTGYDKQLVAKYDNDGFEIGNEAVSNRAMIADFLELLKKSNNYKILVFDLDMSRLLIENQDSTFVVQNQRIASLLSEMDRVVVSQTMDEQGQIQALLDESLESRAGIVTYVRTFKESEVVAVPLISHGCASAPLKMAEILNGVKMKRVGLFFFWNGELCHKRVLPMEYINPSSKVYKKANFYEDHNVYENLGSDIMVAPELIPLRTDGKIVIVGDLINDIHDTYVGTCPGSTILYNTYQSAVNKHHIVYWWWALLLFGFYFVSSLLFLKPAISKQYNGRCAIWRKISDFLEKKWVVFIGSLFGFGAVLIGVKIIAFAIIHIDYNIIVPGFCFGLVGNIYKSFFITQKENEEDNNNTGNSVN